MGSKVLGTGGNKVSGLSRDNSTVGVGNKSGIRVAIGITKSGIRMSISISKSSDWVDGTASSSVFSLGSKNSWLIYGDNSTVGMSHKTIRVSSISMGIRIPSMSIRIPGIGKGQAMSSKVSSLGSSDFSSVSGDNSSVGVSHQLGGGDCYTSGKNLKQGKLLIVRKDNGNCF